MWWTELLVMTAMIALNGVFAGYEIALASISRARLEALARENRRGARSSLAMKNNIERSLAVVQLGITLFGAIAAATGGAGAEELLVPGLMKLGLSPTTANALGIAAVVTPLTVLSIVFGELMPKVFSLRNSEWVCLRLSPVMAAFAAVVRPVVWALEAPVTRLMRWGEKRLKPNRPHREAAELTELRALAALARTAKLIGARQEGIIVNAAKLSGRAVRESMLRAEFISMLDAGSTLADALVAGHLDLHTRFPVTEEHGNPQQIIGYANFKDIVANMRLSGDASSLRGILRPIPSLVEDLPLSTCLEEMIREHTHIALVRNPAGSVTGLITLEDIIEELVGEIQDEYDRLPTHIKHSGSGWVAGGGAPLSRLADITGVNLATDPAAPAARTLAEWMTARLGRAVRGGEVVRYGDLNVIVRNIRRQQLREAQINCETRPAASGGPPTPEQSE